MATRATKATNERMNAATKTATIEGDKHMNTNRQTTATEGDKHMNTNRQTTATKRVPMDSLRKTALVAGVLYLLTFVSIPTLFLYVPVHGANYISGAGPDTAAIIGGILEIIVALAGIGSAVVLFPVRSEQNLAPALGRVVSRSLGCGALVGGPLLLLARGTVRSGGG